MGSALLSAGMNAAVLGLFLLGAVWMLRPLTLNAQPAPATGQMGRVIAPQDSAPNRKAMGSLAPVPAPPSRGYLTDRPSRGLRSSTLPRPPAIGSSGRPTPKEPPNSSKAEPDSQADNKDQGTESAVNPDQTILVVPSVTTNEVASTQMGTSLQRLVRYFEKARPVRNAMGGSVLFRPPIRGANATNMPVRPSGIKK